jgi:hypothetical protein
MAKEQLFDVPARPLEARSRSLREAAPEGLWDRKNYACPELGKTCHRDGAYDAFAFPSLYGDERRYPK